MARDLMPAANRRCYSCVQWEGVRTFFRDKKQIKVDPHEQGYCLIYKMKKTGSMACEHHEPLR